MPQIRSVQTVVFNVSPEEAARVFCEMDSNEQAWFFNWVAKISSEWDSRFEFQMQHVTDESELSDEGRKVMEVIGAYAAKNIEPIKK